MLQLLAPMKKEIGYAVSKGALHQATLTLSDELIGRGITVNTVGVLHTENCVISGFVNGLAYVASTGGKIFIKDTIIRGGENVYPREVEEFLYTHPDVRDVQVVGVPDLRFGAIEERARRAYEDAGYEVLAIDLPPFGGSGVAAVVCAATSPTSGISPGRNSA